MQLTLDYALQPVVFLEQDVDHPQGKRIDRWWAAYGGGSAGVPLVMVDSGRQFSYGYVDFNTVYRGMADAEIGRPALAEMAAFVRRVGDHLRISGYLANRSGVTLNASLNDATLHAIVYELVRAGVTDQMVRAAPASSIAVALPDGSTVSFTLETPDLSGVAWENLRVVACADYRPKETSGPYDMVQAVAALSANGLADLLAGNSGPPWSAMAGDVDGDGSFNATDLARLLHLGD